MGGRVPGRFEVQRASKNLRPYDGIRGLVWYVKLELKCTQLHGVLRWRTGRMVRKCLFRHMKSSKSPHLVMISYHVII